MIYSQSVEYAIRALAHLAAHGETTRKMARQIAEEEDMPAFFLAKTLQQLARNGLLRSVKGPTGGFGLNVPAKRITVFDVVKVLDGTDNLERVLGEMPNSRPIRASILNYLKSTTIADVAEHRKKQRQPVKRRSPRRGLTG